ncbi:MULTISPECIES: class III lanthipeptide [Bacillus cereus group]|nr:MULTISPECIES: class III lanthipeptide [Bacillus cereus group]
MNRLLALQNLAPDESKTPETNAISNASTYCFSNVSVFCNSAISW